MNNYLPQITKSIDLSLESLNWFYPELALGALFVLVIIVGLFFVKRFTQSGFAVAVMGIALTGLLEVKQLNNAGLLFGGMLVLANSIVFFKLIFCTVAVLFCIFIRTNAELQNHPKGTSDLYAILIAVLLGMNLMAMSSNLLMVYLSIEMVSVGSYLMVGYVSGKPQQAEASMKYALFGAICSAVMLYGMSLLYGFSGTLNVFDPAFIAGLKSVPSSASTVALGMVLLGIGFKLAVVPFHFWSPDVYEGAPTPVTAFLSTGPKIAGFAVLMLFLSAFKADAHVFDFKIVVGIAAIASMIVGNFSAIWQDNVKRMLAYSSIGSTGFVLMAVVAFSDNGMQAILFYLFIYALMNMAAFMLADYIEEQTGAANISDYKGLGKQMPLTFFAFVIVLIALIGIPVTAGFISKFLVFSTAFEAYQVSGAWIYMALLITGAIATLVSLFYYFKIPLNAYLRNADDIEVGSFKPGFTVYLSFFISIILLVLGIFPQLLTNCLQ